MKKSLAGLVLCGVATGSGTTQGPPPPLVRTQDDVCAVVLDVICVVTDVRGVPVSGAAVLLQQGMQSGSGLPPPLTDTKGKVAFPACYQSSHEYRAAPPNWCRCTSLPRQQAGLSITSDGVTGDRLCSAPRRSCPVAGQTLSRATQRRHSCASRKAGGDARSR